jgi:hypothetical protein
MLENDVLKLMHDLAVGDQVLVPIYSLDKNLKLIFNREGKSEIPYFTRTTEYECLAFSPFSRALPLCERALEIFQCSLPSNHPHVQTMKESIKFLRKIL